MHQFLLSAIIIRLCEDIGKLSPASKQNIRKSADGATRAPTQSQAFQISSVLSLIQLVEKGN
jgi:hypothetical protein